MRNLILIGAAALQLMAGVRVNVNIGVGHPVRRPLPMVVVRRPPAVAVKAVYAPAVVWTPRAAVAPARFEWEDAETLRRDEDWVESNLSVGARGRELFLRVDGRVQIQFAEVAFRGGQIQVVDFNEHVVAAGTHRLLDFADGREVASVRLVARARTPRAKVAVLMAK